MSDRTTVKVEGLRELGRRIAQLQHDMQHKIARAATGAAAGVVRKDAQRRAPVAPAAYYATGAQGSEPALVQPQNIGRNIITKRTRNAALTSEHIVTVRGKKKHGYASRVAALQEFGTVNQTAQPFLRPAFESNQQAAIDAMKKRLAARIAKAEKA